MTEITDHFVDAGGLRMHLAERSGLKIGGLTARFSSPYRAFHNSGLNGHPSD